MAVSYEFSYIYGSLAQPALLAELAQLYSRHYGRWSQTAPQRPGQNVKLSEDRLRLWLKKDSRISLAKLKGQVVGYPSCLSDVFCNGGQTWVCGHNPSVELRQNT